MTKPKCPKCGSKRNWRENSEDGDLRVCSDCDYSWYREEESFSEPKRDIPSSEADK